MLDTVSFPLAFALDKPTTRLKPGDVFQTKPELARDLIQQLRAFGFHIDVVVAVVLAVVLADTASGERQVFVSALDQLRRGSVVAIRSTPGVWMDVHERLRTAPSSASLPMAAANNGSSQQR